MNALVLAAGYGTRIREVAGNLPKPLLPVGGQTVLDYLFDQFATIDELDRIVIVTNDLYFAQFKEWSAGLCCTNVEVLNDGTRCNEERRGAIGDMQFAIEKAHLDDDLLVSGGDNIFRFQIGLLVDHFRKKRADVVAVIRETRPECLARSSTLRLDEEGRVVNFVEKGAIPLSDLTCPPLYIFRRQTLSLVAKYLEGGHSPDAPGSFLEWLHRRVPVYGMLMPGGRYDIGNPESYREACRALSDDQENAGETPRREQNEGLYDRRHGGGQRSGSVGPC